MLDFVAYEGKTKQQKATMDKNHIKLIDKFKDAPSAGEKQRKGKRENKAARTIQQKKITDKLRLEATVVDKAFKNKMTRIKVVPKGSGEMMVTDLEAGLARDHLMAKRKIKMKDFKINAGIRFKLSAKDDNGDFKEINHTTKAYPNAEKGQMFQELFVFC